MKLLLSARFEGRDPVDVVLTAEAGATVGDAARALSLGGGAAAKKHRSPTLVVLTPGAGDLVLDPALPLHEAPVGSGDSVTIGESPASTGGSGRTFRMLTGPDAGRRVPLKTGLNTIGRDPSCDVVLKDPMVSKRHAKVVVWDTVEVIDDSSANGLVSAGQNIQRMALREGDQFSVGDTLVVLEGSAPLQVATTSKPGTVEFNRSPRVEAHYLGEETDAPEPPTPERSRPLPWITALIPIIMGAVLYQVTHKWFTIVFVAMSPVMVVGGYLQNRRTDRKEFAKAVQKFEQDLAELVAHLRVLQDEERRVRCQEHASTAEAVEAVRDLSPLVWTRRTEHDRWLHLRLGLGRQPSRSKVVRPEGKGAPLELLQHLDASVLPFATIENVPVICALTECGALGISGPLRVREGVAAGIVTQLVGLHSPADVCLAAVMSPTSAARWEWIKWLPHVHSERHPVGGSALADSAGAVAALVADLTGLIDERRDADDDASPIGPVVVVLVEDDAPFVRSAIIDIAERGPAVGIHVIWMANATSLLPAVCRTFLELDPNSFGAATGKVIEGERVEPVITETLAPDSTQWVARRLAPVVDSSIASADESDVPSSVSFVAEAGIAIAESPAFIVERWNESNSIRPTDTPLRRLKRDGGLRALVGRTGADPLHLDLRTQGPHALVGGTTGAGKSEFLQTWVLAMAAAHSPQRVTFLFVDYKGGAAFADCVGLPHSVGLVTDLSPRLVQRALRSLNAELRHREHILNRKRAKDLLELERRQDPDTPPSLVIVIDEFAALVQEVPEFVDGVVNVAQRGRSLGLHLILATQRPAGVIKGNLRANTNLRIALRMADADDSSDVIGVPDAASFDPDIPGRGIARTGPGRLSVFQTGYVGGVTLAASHQADVEVRDLPFALGSPWEVEWSEDAGEDTDDEVAPDIQRIVTTVTEAFDSLGLEMPRRPWLPELATVYDLAALPTTRTDAELVFGVRDDPDAQQQGTVAFHPDSDGSLVVFGTGGSGKSTVLRSIVVAAGLTARGGPCHVYGLDFGSRGLSMLEALPHVGSVIGGDDLERTVRLFRWLKEIIEDRAVRFSAVNAGSLSDYRQLSGRPQEPRIILVLDGYGTFRSAFEMGPNAWLNDVLLSVAVDGRAVGVHAVISADRPGTVPASLASGIQKRLALRMASENDVMMAGVPLDAFDAKTPPGRGFLDDDEVQVGIFGGKQDATSQAKALEKLAASMVRAGATPAPEVARLAELFRLADLPNISADGQPTFGVGDESLLPIGFEPSGLLLVAGPSGSGRSTTVATILGSLRRCNPKLRAAYLGNRRSPLAAMEGWEMSAQDVHASGELAVALTAAIRADAESPPLDVVVVDGVSDYLNTEADQPLQDLLKACRTAGVFVVVDGETSEMAGSWPLFQAVRAQRHGIVLQPDQVDGDVLFKTAFQRMKRADFPVGRGMYVRQGRAFRMQVARDE